MDECLHKNAILGETHDDAFIKYCHECGLEQVLTPDERAAFLGKASKGFYVVSWINAYTSIAVVEADSEEEALNEFQAGKFVSSVENGELNFANIEFRKVETGLMEEKND